MICGDCSLLPETRSRRIDKQTRFRLWRRVALENACRETNSRVEFSSDAYPMKRFCAECT